MSDPVARYLQQYRPTGLRNLTDSLTALTGGPNKYGHPLVHVSPDAEDIGGEYLNGPSDRVILAPNMVGNRDAIAHEFGHRYDTGPAAKPMDRLQAMIPKAAVRADGRHTFEPGFSLPEQTSSEYAADTFSKAVQYLQGPESRGPKAIEALGEIEGRQAGVGEVVRHLLQEPVYAAHPLHDVISPPAATNPSTATADPVSRYLSKYPQQKKPAPKPQPVSIPREPGSMAADVAAQGSDTVLPAIGHYIADEVRRGGASLAEQARQVFDEPSGTPFGTTAAKSLAAGIFHSIDDPLQTVGKALRYPFTRSAADVTPPAELAKAVIMGTALKAAGPAGEAAVDAAAPIVSRIANAVTRKLGATAGAATEIGAKNLISHAAGGATYMVGADPDHPIQAAIVGSVAGPVLGGLGDVAGKAGRTGLRKVGETAENIRDVASAAQNLPDAAKRYLDRWKPAAEATTPAAQQAAPTIPAPHEGAVTISRMPVSEINVDPARFQFKRGTDSETGTGSELKGLSKFDEQLAGVVSVWRDPSDGKVYAVNGHHRLELAKRTDHPSINVQELPAKTAEEAAAQGALANIAEGRGTALDAATFFRSSGLGIDDLKDRVSFKGAIAKSGLGLSKLAPDLFDRVARGEIPENHGAVVGSMLDTPELQRTALSAIQASGKRLSDPEVAEVARQVRDAGTETVSQDNLFGTEDVQVPLYVERAQLAAAIKKRLAGDKRLFGYVSKEGRAEGLSRAGNVIDVEGSRRIADESAQLEEVFNQLYTRKGPIADALTAAARRIANGEKAGGLVEELYPTIRQAVQEAHGRGEGESYSALGARNQNGEPQTGYEATGRQTAGPSPGEVGNGPVPDSTDPSQAGLSLSPQERNAAGPLASPTGADLFGNEGAPAPYEGQSSLFDNRAGTEASRPLTDAERAATGRIAHLRQVLALETDPRKRVETARELVQLEKLVNRDQSISPDEMAARVIAEHESGSPPTGPDQGVLLSPAAQISMAGARIRKALGIKNSVAGDVVALRKISLGLADAVGVPVREGRGNLKRRRALGAFWQKSEMIRVVRMKDLSTVTHEIGHYLSKKYGYRNLIKATTPEGRKAIQAELLRMGHDLYGSRKPAAGYAEEGVAQFFSFFVTDRERMMAEAPNTAAYMDGVLQKEPALLDALNKAHENWTRYEAAPANAKIGSMIERGVPSLFENTDPSRIVDHWFNDLAPIVRATEALGTPENYTENAAILARLTKGDAGRARDILDNGVIDFATRSRVTRGLKDILRDVGEKERDGFTEYIVARQVLTKTNQGIDTGFDVNAAREVVNEGSKNAKWQKAATEIWQFRSALLDYLEGAGLMTKPEVAAIKQGNPTPTPFYRSFDANEQGGGMGRSSSLVRGSSGIHKLIGSDRPITDPLQSIVSDTYRFVDMAQKHYAAATLLKAAISTEGGARIATVLTEMPMEARRIGISRVRDQLVEAGWTPPDDPGLTAALGDMTLQAFYEKKQAGAREVRDRVLPVLINGERKWIQVNDNATWEAIQNMTVAEIGPYERIITAPTRALRMGATQANPDFALVNPFRDAFTASIYSQAPGFNPPGSHLLRGVAHLLKSRLGSGDEIVDRWAQEGGENAGMVGADKRTMRIAYEKQVSQLMASPMTRLKSEILNPVRTMRDAFEVFENATRVGEFAKVRAAEMKKGVPEIEASTRGSLHSRDVTQDFFLAGSTARVVNRYVPFFTAQLGDIRKLAIEFNPMNLATPETARRMATVTARAIAYVTIPSLYLYLSQKDDPAYQEIPEYYKANAWVLVDREHGPIPFTTESGEKIRVWAWPRPYLLGYLFGYTPEKLLEWANTHDPEAVANLGKQLWSAFVPPVVPTILGPLVENYANKSLFTRKPIVPQHTQGLDASEQVRPYTGEAARIVGKAVGYSPAKIENVVRGYSGGAGLAVKDVTDAAIRKLRELSGKSPLRTSSPTAADPLDRTPVIGRFILPPPGSGSKSVTKLYSDFADAERKRQTVHRMLAEGRRDQAVAYMKANYDEIMSVATQDDAEKPGALRLAQKAMGDITAKRREIAESGASSEEKDRQERELERAMVNVARLYYASVKDGTVGQIFTAPARTRKAR